MPASATFNFDTNYIVTYNFSVVMRITSLFDRDYYKAGYLEVDPFPPSTIVAIGPCGFNYNSDVWQPTRFVSSAAPRGIFLAQATDSSESTT